jgi:hypothetical protein
MWFVRTIGGSALADVQKRALGQCGVTIYVLVLVELEERISCTASQLCIYLA